MGDTNPRSIGPYEIRGELGRGAMAVVWRGYDPKLEREVAIKEPLAGVAGGELAAELGERFVREGRTAAQLSHPGIVTVFAADVFDGRPAIVMELVEGTTLSDILDQGALDVSSAMAIADQLLDAAGYAHTRGVVHRDIKPDNVFVTTDGRVKLADFGIAHTATSSTLTQAGTVMGTPGYMAPEQVTGQAVDARADVFSVGVILYQMLSGVNPFGATQGTAATAVMYRVVHEPVASLPPAVCDDVSVNVNAVLVGALAKEPTERYSSAEAFRTALHGGPITVGESAVAGGSGASSVLTLEARAGMGLKTVSRTSWLPYVVAIAVAAAGIGSVFYFGGTAPSGGDAAGGMSVPASATEVGSAPGEPVVDSEEDKAPVEEEAEVAAEPVADPGPDPYAVEQEVRMTIDGWISAWEATDLGRYMGYYSPAFYSKYKRMNYDQWRSYKQGLFASNSWTRVGVSDLQVGLGPELDTATVTFLQDYSASGGHHDFGLKTLTLSNGGSGWVITGEEWSER